MPAETSPPTVKAAVAKPGRIRRFLDSDIGWSFRTTPAAWISALVLVLLVVTAFLAPLIAAARVDHWFEPPVKAQRDALRTGISLYDDPALHLAASVLSADALAAQPPPRSAIVSGRMTVIRFVRAGNVTLHRWQAAPLRAPFVAAQERACAPLPPMYPADGAVVTIDGRTTALQFAGATPGVCGSCATPMKFFGKSFTTRWIRVLQASVQTSLVLAPPM